MLAEHNLADLCMTSDLPGAEEHARAALGPRPALRGRGSSRRGRHRISCTSSRWQDGSTKRNRLGTELLQAGGDERPGAELINYALACLQVLRGNVEAAREHADRCGAWAESDDVQEQGNLRGCRGDRPPRRRRQPQGARYGSQRDRRCHKRRNRGGARDGPVRVPRRCRCCDRRSATSRRPSRLAELLATRPRGEVPPFLRAQVTRAKALVAAARGEDEEVETDLATAEATFRDLGYPYWTARAQLDRAEWLVHQDRLDESAGLATEAAAAFEAVGAAPMLARARSLLKLEVLGHTSAPGELAVAQSGPSPAG